MKPEDWQQGIRSKVLAWVSSFLSGDPKKQVVKFLNDRKSDIQDEAKYVEKFRSTLTAARCALANIPTYMICDDHEVTDDWNMTRRCALQLYGTEVGIRIVQNGLTAFSLCQAWGNAPERFSPQSAGQALLAKLAAVSAGTATYEDSSLSIQTLLGIHNSVFINGAGGVFHDGEDNLPANGINSQSLRYNFVIEGKGHVIVVTDTRTWRSYSNSDGHATFLPTSDRPEMTRQFASAKPSVADDRLLIVVVTTNAQSDRELSVRRR